MAQLKVFCPHGASLLAANSAIKPQINILISAATASHQEALKALVADFEIQQEIANAWEQNLLPFQETVLQLFLLLI